jgi:hypothetical protein
MGWAGLAAVYLGFAAMGETPLFLRSNFNVNIYLLSYLFFTISSFLFPALAGQFDLGTAISHIAVFFVILSLSVLLIRTGLTPLFGGVFLGAQITHLMDWVAFIFNTPLNTKTDSFGLGYAGIGVPLGFGQHGIILNWGIFSGLAILLTKKLKPVSKCLVTFIMFGMVAMVIISQSRSSIFALIFGFGALLIFYPYRSALKKLPAKVVTMPIGVSMALYGLFVAYNARPRTLHIRLDQFYHVFEVAQKNPISGIGWNIWHPKYDSHVIHNTFLNYLAAAGYIPFLIYIGLIAYVGGFFLYYQRNITARRDKVTYITSFSIFLSTLAEVNFFKATPSLALAISGLIMVLYPAIIVDDRFRKALNQPKRESKK